MPRRAAIPALPHPATSAGGAPVSGAAATGGARTAPSATAAQRAAAASGRRGSGGGLAARARIDTDLVGRAAQCREGLWTAGGSAFWAALLVRALWTADEALSTAVLLRPLRAAVGECIRAAVCSRARRTAVGEQRRAAVVSRARRAAEWEVRRAVDVSRTGWAADGGFGRAEAAVAVGAARAVIRCARSSGSHRPRCAAGLTGPAGPAAGGGRTTERPRRLAGSRAFLRLPGSQAARPASTGRSQPRGLAFALLAFALLAPALVAFLAFAALGLAPAGFGPRSLTAGLIMQAERGTEETAQRPAAARRGDQERRESIKSIGFHELLLGDSNAMTGATASVSSHPCPFSCPSSS